MKKVLKQLVKESNDYQKRNKHNNDRTIGFVDGFERANELFALYNVSQQSELFYNFITWYNAKPRIEKPKDGLITTTIIEEFIKL